MEMDRSMLHEKSLHPNFCFEGGVYTTMHLLNRFPTKVVEGMAPMKAWSGTMLEHLKLFGSI